MSFRVLPASIALLFFVNAEALRVQRGWPWIEDEGSAALEVEPNGNQLCHLPSLSALCYTQKDLECFQNPREFFTKWVNRKIKQDKEKQKFVNAVKSMAAKGNKLKIQLGGGYEGPVPDEWYSTDRAQLDLFEAGDWARAFRNVTVDAFFAEHVLEHFTPSQAKVVAALTFLFLRPGGRVRIAVPDAYRPYEDYQSYVRAGSTPSGQGQNHMIVWSSDSMPPIFKELGFNVTLMEHFDQAGTFHQNPHAYDDDYSWGKVRRSKRHDDRNDPKSPHDEQLGGHGFTSLWFDAQKPLDCPGLSI